MGETADDLRRQVDQKRDDASQKIDQIEQQVMGKAQEIEGKVTDTAQQVKAQMDWRHQVDEHPLKSVGAAMIGGMLLGGMTGKGDHHEYQPSGEQMRASQRSHGPGLGDKIRKAASDAGFDDSIQNFASAGFSMLGQRMRDMTERTFPGMLDRVHQAADKSQRQAGYADAGPSDRPAPPRDSSIYGG